MTLRSSEELPEVLPGLVEERGWTMSYVAERLGVHRSFLSRVVNRTESKVASEDLARRVSALLELPDDYFPEVRRARVARALEQDIALVDRVYDDISSSG